LAQEDSDSAALPKPHSWSPGSFFALPTRWQPQKSAPFSWAVARPRQQQGSALQTFVKARGSAAKHSPNSRSNAAEHFLQSAGSAAGPSPRSAGSAAEPSRRARAMHGSSSSSSSGGSTVGQLLRSTRRENRHGSRRSRCLSQRGRRATTATPLSCWETARRPSRNASVRERRMSKSMFVHI